MQQTDPEVLSNYQNNVGGSGFKNFCTVFFSPRKKARLNKGCQILRTDRRTCLKSFIAIEFKCIFAIVLLYMRHKKTMIMKENDRKIKQIGFSPN